MGDESEIFMEKLTNKINSPSKVSCRVEAEKFVKWCLIGRKNNYCSLIRTLQTLKNQSEANIIKYEACNSKPDIEIKEKIAALCGISKHNISFEAFCADTAYKFSDLIYKKTRDTVPDNSNEVIINDIEKFNSNIKKSYI